MKYCNIYEIYEICRYLRYWPLAKHQITFPFFVENTTTKLLSELGFSGSKPSTT